MNAPRHPANPANPLNPATPPARPAFDPDAAAVASSGIFGLPEDPDAARIIIIPVPWDATVSYGARTAGGPAAVLEASKQVDLYDRRFGRIYERGIWMPPIDASIAQLSAQMRALAEPLIRAGGATPADADAVQRIDGAGARLEAMLYDRSRALLSAGKVPALLGGDHSTPLGLIRACAQATDPAAGLGILHVDAHMDLRQAFEGLAFSHASIMYNVLTRIPGVTRLVQIGIRDFGEGELDFAIEQGRRVSVHFDDDWAQQQLDGRAFADLAREALAPLPRDVYISFDIDGLDPSLCPHTGTPVPGGLSFHQASHLLWALRESGRRVVGFDLVEAAPGGDTDWDANVAARLLYKICGTIS